MNLWCILLAAGSGSRLAKAGLDQRKQFLPYQGAPLFWYSARTLARIASLGGIVFVFPPEEIETSRPLTQKLNASNNLGFPYKTVAGGERRQDSVRLGLSALPADCDTVLVHDAARPFASPRLITRLITALEQGVQAVIPAIPLKDTVKRVREDMVLETLPRHELAAVQTPQGFKLEILRQAHALAEELKKDATDDASLVELLGIPVTVIPGEEDNVKITNPEDLRLLAQNAPPEISCVGWGYDVHRYVPSDTPKARPLKLGGIPIDGGPCVQAHSDGDVLLHALTDALLGCTGGGDIGARFPDTDPANDNLPSAVILDVVLRDALRQGFKPMQADLTIIAQTPKISPSRDRIRNNVAGLLNLPTQRVNVKATTEEGLGFTGEKKGIKAVAVVTGLMPAKPEAD
jgi:2-C-methyl-D-erythritol 4-phosphate cytidylyltransferase / 2-C-methyl-D-erythritol 2,4-cyclodiphosphate synthase